MKELHSDFCPGKGLRLIIDYAKSHTESELHKCFTWDDAEAADRYRVEEAKAVASAFGIKFKEFETSAVREELFKAVGLMG